MKLHSYGFRRDGSQVLCFYCPGCKCGHPYDVPRWTWNGSMDKPTFTPSLLCNGHMPERRCHLFVTDGMIKFFEDCHHELAGKTVEIPDWETEEDD